MHKPSRSPKKPRTKIAIPHALRIETLPVSVWLASYIQSTMRAAGFRFLSGAFYFHSFQAWDWMGWKWQIPFQTLGVELIQRWSLTIFVQVRQHPLDQSLVCIGFGKLAGLTAAFLTILWTYRQMNVQKRHKNQFLGLSVQMRKKYVIPPVKKKKKKKKSARRRKAQFLRYYRLWYINGKLRI